MKIGIKKTMVFLMVFALSVGAFARGGHDKEEKIERKIQRVKVLLKKIEREYISCINYNDRREAIRKMDNVMKILSKIENMKKQEEHNYIYGAQGMSKGEFSKYYGILLRHRVANEQLKYITLTAHRKDFSINQLIKIMKVFKFDREKLQATSVIYPRVVDKKRSYLLFRQMKHNSSMDKLERIIIKHR